MLVDSNVVLLFLRPIEEREGKDEDGGGGCCDISVFVIILWKNISFRDKIQLPGKIGKVHTLT